MKTDTQKKSAWGVGLMIVYGAFVVGILVMVYIAVSQHIDLVSEKYYDQGIHFQERIMALENTKSLREKPSITIQSTELVLQFPKEFAPDDISGTIALYRPDNKQKDTSVEIVLDTTGSQRMQSSSLLRGLWRVKVDWNAKGLKYYTEQVLVIP